MLDICLASCAIVVLSPLMVLVAVLIRVEDGGRVIFRQKRVGKGGNSFWLLKFRSMPENTGDLPSDSARHVAITRVGRVIRRTNIDELPQLLNILRGEMSIVGPRPALPSQCDLVRLREVSGALRCTPGLTGLAQVNATDGMSVEQKAKWDAKYAERISLSRDVQIIVRTFRYVLSPPPTY